VLAKLAPVAAVFAMLSCAGSQSTADEPVQATAVPDAPGMESGESPAPDSDPGTAPAESEPKMQESQAPAAGQQAMMVVEPSHLNVRQGPGMSHDVVRVILQGETVSILGQEGLWAQIGENEYVSTRFLKAAP